MTQNTTTPRFTDCSDEELREAYRHWRTAAWNWSQMAGGGSRVTGKKIAIGVGRCLRNVEIIEAIARKRRIRL